MNIKVLKALSDEVRIQIMLFLSKERSVLEIVSHVGKSQPNVSIALSKLENVGLVVKRKKGKQVLYKVKDKMFMKNLSRLINAN